MPTPTNLGLPCLLPVQVRSESGERSRGFVTRLSEVSACISSSPELAVGDNVELTIRRPADNQTVVLSATVERQLKEGGLWRGRSAALVTLTSALDETFLGTDSVPEENVSAVPLRRGSEASEQTPYKPNRTFSAPLLSGLGRRRKPRTSGRPTEPQSTKPAVLTPPVREPAPPPRSKETVGPAIDLDMPAPLRLGPESGIDANLSAPSAEALELPNPPEGLLSALPDEEGGAPLSIPGGPIVLNEVPDPHEPSLESLEGLESLELNESMDLPPVRQSADFWSDESWDSDDSLDSLHESLIPRAARIPSGVPVHFWTLGQRLGATARNFSAEGMYLSYDGPAPARGASVRIEFAIGDTRPNAAIRFTAEVRWHHSDRPGSDLPEGYGVLIREFEDAGDERRYSKLLLYLLSIDTTPPSKKL